MSLTVKSTLFPIIPVDMGRKRVGHQGYTESGPMDEIAYSWAIRLVGWNTNNALEIIGNATFQFSKPAIVSVCGPDTSILLNENQVTAAWESFIVKEGDTLTISKSKVGSRCYLAIAGGFKLPKELGSVCAVKREGLGGTKLDGTGIIQQDSISFVTQCLFDQSAPRTLPQWCYPNYDLKSPIKIVEGYQVKYFTQLSIRRFYSSSYTVSTAIDRMGYRLEGPSVISELSTLKSEAIVLGAIQCPPSGQPIVMMRDRQTLGGYPKIGSISRADFYRFAQASSFDEVCFMPVSAEEARASWLLEMRKLAL